MITPEHDQLELHHHRMLSENNVIPCQVDDLELLAQMCFQIKTLNNVEIARHKQLTVAARLPWQTWRRRPGR